MGCQSCQNKNSVPVKHTVLTPAKVVHGAIGIAKAALHIGRASEEEVAKRRNLCRNCEHATRNDDPKFKATNGLTNLSQCQKCSCVILAKTSNKDEKCPLGRW